MALMLVPMECMMRNWLDAWRSLNKDCVQVTKTASRLKKLVSEVIRSSVSVNIEIKNVYRSV